MYIFIWTYKESLNLFELIKKKIGLEIASINNTKLTTLYLIMELLTSFLQTVERIIELNLLPKRTFELTESQLKIEVPSNKIILIMIINYTYGWMQITEQGHQHTSIALFNILIVNHCWIGSKIYLPVKHATSIKTQFAVFLIARIRIKTKF